MTMHARGIALVKVICEPAIQPVHEPATTVSPFLVRLRAVEKKRLSLRISRRQLAELAGISERAICYALAGRKGIRPSTLRRLEGALDAYRSRRAPPASFAGELYRSLLIAFAAEAGVAADLVLAADPRRERGPIARARMRAVYVMVTELDLSMTAVAGLAGVTKQAVSKSLRDIEDEREDPACDALIARVARRVAGRG